MKYLKISIVCVLVLAGIGFISPAGELGPNHEFDIIGTRALDVNGQLYRIGIENKKTFPISVVFIDIGCPISQRMIPYLNELYADAQQQEVQFYGIVSNPKVKIKEAQTFVKEFDIQFPILFDSNGDLANRLKPTVVPESFVFDIYDKLVYNGRINDQYADIGKYNKQIRNADLQNAIHAVAKGKDAPSKHEEAKGCIFESWDRADREITFYRDIEPLTRANCATCHRPNDIGPFALQTYEDVSRRGRMVEYVTQKGYMPIWKAKHGYGKFSNEHRLSEYQINLIKKWVATGMKEGNKESTIPLQAPPVSEWKLGEPDLILKMEPYGLPASGDDQYRVLVMKNAIPKGKTIKAIDFKPGDPSVVHHSTIFVDYTQTLRKYDDEDPLPGYDAFKQGGTMEFGSAVPVCGWAPGIEPYAYPDKAGFYVEQNADLAFENHYHLSGKATTDQSYIGIYFDKKGDTEKYMTGSIIGTQRLQIPSRENNFTKTIWAYVPVDIELFDLTPHMHYIGKEVKVDIVHPNGKTVPLLHVDDWDLRWQSVYTLRELTLVPKGSIIKATFSYDNSDDNHDNPYYPSQEMYWGWGSNDEMCEVYFSYVPVNYNDYGKMLTASFASFEHSYPLEERKAVNLENLKQVAADFSKADVWSTDGRTWLYSILESCMTQEVLKEMDKLKDKDENFTINQGELMLMDAYLSMNEGKMYSVGNKTAINLYKVLVDHPNNWNANFSYGSLLLDSGEPKSVKEGLEVLEGLVEHQDSYGNESKHAQLYFKLGRHYYGLGNDAKAEAILKKGLEKFPNDIDLNQELESKGRIIKKTLNN